MLSTIENSVKDTKEELVVKAERLSLSKDDLIKRQQIHSWLATGGVFTGLSLAIILSITNGQLFLKELSIGSFIIMGLMVMKSIDSKNI